MAKAKQTDQLDLFIKDPLLIPQPAPVVPRAPDPLPEPEPAPAEEPIPEEVEAAPEPEAAPTPAAPSTPRETEAPTLFGDLDQFAVWWAEWVGMPEFVQEDIGPWKSMYIHFANRADMEAFSKLISQPLTYQTRSVWYPKAEIGHMVDKRYHDEEKKR